MSTSTAESALAGVSEPAGADPMAVSSAGLTKRFRGGQVAVDRIDLAVPDGSVFGFLGPNGSGKTTTMRMLLGLIRPTAGTHTLLGRPMPQRAGDVLPQVGSLVEGPAFHPYLSGRTNLQRLDAADRYADPRTATARIGTALDRVGLAAAAGKRFRNYSLGRRHRLGTAAALLQPRRLLMLDEPTNGLDPQGTREVRTLIKELADTGATVLLSTHLLAEVEQICTHVGVMHRGRLVAQSSLGALRASTAPTVFVDTDRPALAQGVFERLGLREVAPSTGGVAALLGAADPAALAAALVRDGVPIRGFGVREADLEELFVGLTGEGFDVNG
ncbi:ABC transporter ATP-binding protein [soil metagenome]